MRLRAWTTVVAPVLLLAAGCSDAPEQPTTPPPPERVQLLPNPIKGRTLYNDYGSKAHQLLATAKQGSPEQKALQIITSRPAATWLTGNAGDAASVARVTSGVAAVPGSVALLVFYNQPHRDSCSGSSAGGATGKESFLQWNQQMIDAMQGDKTAVVVFAPDALAEIATNCLGDDDAQERIDTFAEAIKALVASPHVALTCIDAGHPGWVDGEALSKLLVALWQVGINQTGCVSLNVSNAYSDKANLDYVKQINGRGFIAPVAALVDTGRNGGGEPPSGQWCNVPGRKLGRPPTTKTGTAEIYAYAYIKRPGQSDGDGKGCPAGSRPAGEFDMNQAVSLARDAH